ncbi:MAG: SH3 domain-containing protein [Alphaproteobacteria bacterium]
MKKLLAPVHIGILALWATVAMADGGGINLQFKPFAGSLKREEVNVRAGPGTRYPVLWIFQRTGWPVRVLAQYDNWLKIRDIEGEEGWVYLNMVSSQKTAVVSGGEPAVMYKDAAQSKAIFRLSQGVVVKVESCGQLQCEVEVQGSDGWLAKDRLIAFSEELATTDAVVSPTAE